MIEGVLLKTAKPLIDVLVKDIITRKVKQFEKNCKLKYNELLIPRENHFIEYIDRAYEKYSIIHTLVFNNSQRQLKDVYVPQTLIKDVFHVNEREPTKIDSFPVSLMKKYKKILISDTAGMGKSTIMKRMFLDLVEQGLNDVGIPIFIELNRLDKYNSILNQIQKELNSLSEEFDNDLLLKFIQTGGFVFFFDGYDEINADKIEVTHDIKDFISKAGTKNYYILTSRPEDILNSFGDFQLFKIQSLTNDEAFMLLNKYDLSKRKEISKRLIRLLKLNEYEGISEYMENPLLVSLLFIAFSYNQSIPLEKHRFYETVFNALFDKHDNTKPIKPRKKLSGLNYDGFNRVLRYIGFDCIKKNGVQFSESNILNSISRAKEFCCNLSFSESDFLKDLVTSVPLFCRVGIDYKWAHKSLLEYYAANFIFCDAKQYQDSILSSIYHSKSFYKYYNLLDIYYEIDYKGFSKNILLRLCEDYLEFYNNNINEVNSKINKKLIEERISLLFDSNYYFMPNYSKNKDEVKSLFKKFGYLNPNAISVENNCLYVAREICLYNFSLIRLLYNKKPSLFLEKKVSSKDSSCWKLIYDNNNPDKIYELDIKTGESSRKLYNAFNDLMRLYLTRPLDINECKKEIKRIKKENNSGGRKSDLLIGI